VASLSLSDLIHYKTDALASSVLSLGLGVADQYARGPLDQLAHDNHARRHMGSAERSLEGQPSQQ
jgi:hypothetical protein